MFSMNVAASLFIGLALLSSLPGHRTDEALEPLSIETSSGTLGFLVEVVATPDEQARGLMYRKSMPPDYGMLFPQKNPRQVSFWMKNTYISLDILFLSAGGKVLQIEENTVPLSEASISSRDRISAVLEINGGLSNELGISPGDIVHHRFFGNIGD